MFEKMKYLETRADDLRKLMLREPRGYPASNCNLILPSTNPEAVARFVIMEQTEYPPMSGTDTICVVTVPLETGMIPIRERIMKLKLDTPAGLVEVEAEIKNKKVKRVTFQNVPAFAVHLDTNVEVPGLGPVKVDVAYGEMIKAAANEQLRAVHPENSSIAGITIAQLSAPADHSHSDCKNTVIVSTGKLDWNRADSWTGALDRSPCGSGTCAKMATLHAKGKLPLHQDLVHEGILGTTFIGRLIAQERVGPYHAVVPTISGSAWITGIAQYVLDSDDPFPTGYTVGDMWGTAD